MPNATRYSKRIGAERFHNQPPTMTGFCPVSPSTLKARAIERGTTETYGPLTVTPEGMYTLKGRKATLNEAIIALGRHWKSLAA